MIKPTLSQYIRVRICQRVEPILECIDVLYDAWNKDLPAAAEKDRSYIDPNYIPDYNADDEDLDEDDYDVIDNPEDEDYFDGKSLSGHSEHTLSGFFAASKFWLSPKPTEVESCFQR